MELKFKKLNDMMKYIIMAWFLAVAMTLRGIGINIFVSILGAFALLVLVYMLCVYNMYLQTNHMRKLNERMNETKKMDGYLEAMEKIGKRTVWSNVVYQTLLNRGTGYINLGEYRKALEVMDELEKYTVPVEIRFLEVWNRLFALIELRNYGQAEKLMKKYQKMLDHYAEASDSIADRLELYRYLTAGDNQMALEKIRTCREKCKDEDPSAMDQLDYYEIRLCQLTGDHDRVEELKDQLRKRTVFPCIARIL